MRCTSTCSPGDENISPLLAKGGGEMYQKVLLPLDSSKLAECALAEVKKLAEGGFVRAIVLLSVVDIPMFHEGEGIDRYPMIRKSHFEELHKYLNGVSSRIDFKGVEVTAEIQEGNPAQMIINYTKKNAVDLIIIGTHGYSGIKRLMFGSVALQVLHESDVPVLLIQPESC
jgi:nucleotide-binding universal stress UspA family protein